MVLHNKDTKSIDFVKDFDTHAPRAKNPSTYPTMPE